MARTSFTLVMLAIAGGMALMLAAIGIYGVLAYTVAQRKSEVAIRMALGAQPGAVKRMFVQEGLALTAMGVTVGLAAAAGVSRFLAALLFHVKPLDPATYAATAMILVAAAAMASYLPAQRAAKVDPVETQRELMKMGWFTAQITGPSCADSDSRRRLVSAKRDRLAPGSALTSRCDLDAFRTRTVRESEPCRER